MKENPTLQMLKYRNAEPDEARFYWTGGPVEMARGVYFQSMFSGCTAFETKAGLFLVDTGTAALAGALNGLLRQKSQQPLHTVLYTHGHVDHAFGTQAFLRAGEKPARVIAHPKALERFGRYEKTQGHNAALNARQFAGTVEGAGAATYQIFKAPLYLPDMLVEKQEKITLGERSFEVYYDRGETDDSLWVFEPATKTLCTGDLFIWAVPNAGNPQKVQRYPWEWAAALRKMAALKPANLCPGHGGPIVGDPQKIQRMLTETAEFLESIVEQTLAAMNEGSPPHVDVIHKVKLPVSDSPWLYPGYDDPEFLARSVIRFFGGWWTGRPSELKPAPRLDVARELAALSGGAEKIAARARELLGKNELRLASHLADFALEADPESDAVQALVVELYERRAEEEPSLMASNLFKSAAAYAKKGKPFG